MKKAKKNTADKSVKSRTKSKAKIQVKAKAKSPVKRKAARKSRLLSPEDLLVQSITTREERRTVIPESAERNIRSALNKVSNPKKILPRKVAGKKPVFPLAHSE